ncbi:MAG: dynamin family protein [Chthoniobacterales bacterium]
MTAPILSLELKQQFELLRGLLQRAVWLAERCADYDATTTLHARLTNLQSAALLVIVGEVKAGKSSFVNALVREEICEVAPGPCTTAIRELVYGAERSAVTLGPSWDRVFLPKDVLREISIVDTPGTNSIIHNHQTVTENYVPQSDLVVFVFSAPNPHTKSAWELLKLIRKEWRRKTVFVLQQSDRASETELTTNREHVKQYALERHVDSPMVFTLSAKREMEGRPDSGFGEFRDYLGRAVACGDVWRMKVEGSYETIRTVTTKLLAHLSKEQETIAEERAFYQELLHKVEARETTAGALKDLILSKISSTYDDLARRSEDEFTQSLGLANLFRRTFTFSPQSDDGHERHRELARKRVVTEARQITHDLSAEIQAMMSELKEAIAQREERMRENALLPQGAEGFKTLETLRTKLARPRFPDDFADGDPAGASDIARLVIAGCGLSIVGIAVTLLVSKLWLNIAGGVFALLGIFLIIAGLLYRRSNMLHNFRQKLGASRQRFHERLESELAEVFEGVFYEVHQALAEVIFRLDLQASHLAPVVEETFKVGEGASELLLRFQREAVARIFS